MELLTNSRLKAFRACQRMHHFSYVLGFRPVRMAPALAFGIAGVHTPGEQYWAVRGGIAERIAPGLEGLQPWEAALAAIPDTLEPFDRARAEAMMAAYASVWDGIPAEVLAVEREFVHPLVNPATGRPSPYWQRAGKMDAVLRLADGRIAVLEHKSTSEDPSAGSTYRKRLTLDGQVSHYVAGARAVGLDVDLVLYDVLVKPRHKPFEASAEIKLKKDGTPRAGQRTEGETPEAYRLRVAEAIAAAPDAFFAQIEVVRLADERADYEFDVWQWAGVMREAMNSGRAPANPDACHRYGAPCAFWDVCTGTASLDDPTRFVRVANVHPELSEVVQPAAPERAA